MRTESVHQVETPEYVVFDFELAGLASRATAWGVDGLIMAVLTLLLFMLASAISAVLAGLGTALALILLFLVQWGYFLLFEWLWNGRTPGKRLVGLRVIQDTGVRVGFYQAATRNLLRVLDSLPFLYLVGGAATLLGRRRRLGDLLAGTVVVRERRLPVPSAVIPAGERYNTFHDDRAALAAARAAVTPELRETLVALCLRREEIALEPRLALFRRLAEHLGALGVPRPENLSDERFVESATAAVLES